MDLAVVLGSLKVPEDSPFGEGFQIFHEAQAYHSMLEVVCLDRGEFDQDYHCLPDTE
ncbi:MAG: hypothetical protein OEW45_03505 [Deltaproteobacteria bacterium]|nr:hypothetical protein [Deltaproteobacteria bacterium]